MKDVWIGLVGVGALPGNTSLGRAKGAYVNVLALASSIEEYEDEVTRALLKLGFFAFEFEDTDRFSERARRHLLDETFYALAEDVRRSGNTCFGDFCTYDSADS